MGRRRRSKLKAWPLLLILALVYWGREHLGIKDVSDLESLSEAALPVVIVLFVIAGIWLLLSKLGSRGGDDEEEKNP